MQGATVLFLLQQYQKRQDSEEMSAVRTGYHKVYSLAIRRKYHISVLRFSKEVELRLASIRLTALTDNPLKPADSNGQVPPGQTEDESSNIAGTTITYTYDTLGNWYLGIADWCCCGRCCGWCTRRYI